MKFGNLLRTSAADVPELQKLFVCYKQLKKKLKRLPARRQTPGTDGVDLPMTLEERSFVQTLNADVLQFNDLFIEKEEESVIRLGDLEEQASTASSSEEIARVLTNAVDLHGQLLLLVHWSILAYTGLVKILKKHRKRTGFPIRAPHLENLLSQPFCSVELLSQLVRKAEQTSQQLSSQLRSSGGKPEAARSSNSPRAELDDLILAARTSFQDINKDEEPAEQLSSSDGGSSDQGHKHALVAGTDADGLGEDGANSAPTVKSRGVSAPEPGTGQGEDERAAAGDTHQPHAKRRRVAVAVTADTATPQQQGNSEGIKSNSGAQGPVVTVLAPQTSATDPVAGAVPPHVPSAGPLPGPRASVLRQTQAALGLWAQLHDNASTPSTVFQPFQAARWTESAAPSQSTDQSAA